CRPPQSALATPGLRALARGVPAEFPLELKALLSKGRRGRAKRAGWGERLTPTPASPRDGKGYEPAPLTASVSAPLANPRPRWLLSSTEPWRSPWTSTPSAAFCAAASIVAASSFLPVEPASTPFPRTALVPAPVTPTPTVVAVPCLSSVTAAATPTTAKRDAG